MGIYGYMWVYMGIYGVHMGIYGVYMGYIWGIYGYVWVYIGIYTIDVLTVELAGKGWRVTPGFSYPGSEDAYH